MFKKFFLSFFIFLVSFVLISIGIKWGLPSSKRSKLIIEKNQSSIALEKIKNVLNGDNWKSSHQTAYFKDDIKFLLNIIRTYQPDEQYILKALASMKPAKLNFDPNFYIYPAFLIYLTGVLIKIFHIFGLVILIPDIYFYYLNPDEFARLFLIGRFICAAFGACISILVFLITKKIYNQKNIVFFSTLLIIFLPLNIYWSKFLSSDIPAAFFSLLTLYFCIILINNKDLKTYIFCCISIGLALSSKYTSLPIFFVFFVAHLFNNSKILNKHFIFSCILSIIIFLCINPYLLLSFKKVFIDFQTIKNVKEFGWGYNSLFIPPMFINIFSSLIYNGLGLLYTILAALTLILSPFLFWRSKEKIILIIYIFIYYLFYATSKYVAYHYLLIFIPVLNIIMVDIIIKFTKKFSYFILAFIFISFITYDFIYFNYFLNIDTRYETGLWIKNNIPKFSTIGHYDSSIAYNSPPINIFNYYLLNIKSKDELLKQKPDYFFLSNYIVRHYFRLKDKMKINEFALIDYLFNSNEYKIIYDKKYPLQLFCFKLNKTPTITDDMLHLNPEFIIFKRTDLSF
ncbi:MAG TPA: glycosyltransferase family 39 protein [bacterium]|nr:glycosyltransferase family 39 protein [bacterium]HOL46867.1 glycosyltransferase family 39 protein [bacterium]HPQ18784.1 glycosyltransferase family 39 protein [bacterium]